MEHTKPSIACPDCGSIHLVRDYEENELICSMCGQIVDKDSTHKKKHKNKCCQRGCRCIGKNIFVSGFLGVMTYCDEHMTPAMRKQMEELNKSEVK